MTQQRQEISSKAELIDHTTREWRTFVSYVDALPEASWTGPTDPAGWSVKDHVAHVTQWDIAITELFRTGTPMQVTLDSPDGEWNVDYTSINERLRQRTLHDPVEQVRTDRDAAWTDLLVALAELTDYQLATPAGEIGINVAVGDQTPLLPTLVVYLGGHYTAHADMISTIVEGTQTT